MLKEKSKAFRKRVYREYRKAYNCIWGRGYFFKDEVDIPPSLRQYDREFRKEFRNFGEIVSLEEILKQARDSEVIYLGDFHPLRKSKLELVPLIEMARRQNLKTVILMEDFRISEQIQIDNYLAKKIDREELRDRTKNGKGMGKSSWRGVMALLNYAQEKEIPIYGMDLEGRTLRKRDQFYSEMILEMQEKYHPAQAFVIAGDLHLARKHLPGLVAEKRKDLRDVIIHQGLENIFWYLFSRGLVEKATAIKISPKTYCLNTIPLLLKALVYENSCCDEAEQQSSDNLVNKYTLILHNILRSSLGLNGKEIIRKMDLETAEKLVYGNLGKDETLQIYRDLPG